jgi:precorrin-6B methylase 2
MAKQEISTPGQLMEMVNAFRTSRVILTAHELGIFDFLKGKSIASAEVARLLGTDPRATDRLMNALVALGLMRKKYELFSNSGFSEKHMVTTSPGFLGGLSHAADLWRNWSTLTPAVAAGTSVTIKEDINERSEAWREAFIAAMHARAATQAREVASTLTLPPSGKILDVGGGSGIFAFAFINASPELSAVVFDLPNIIPITERYIRQAGLDNCVGTMAGDYLKDDLGSGYAMVFMSAIIHINNTEENKRLISAGAKALAPGGHLVVLDHVMEESRTEPFAGALFALNMLVGTDHGDTYTRSEISSWMSDAGLTEIVLQHTPSGIALLSGKK